MDYSYTAVGFDGRLWFRRARRNAARDRWLGPEAEQDRQEQIEKTEAVDEKNGYEIFFKKCRVVEAE